MAERLWWPRAWLYWLAAFIGSFAFLEDVGYRGKHPKHPTLSRWLARLLYRVTGWIARKLRLDPDRHRWIGPAMFAGGWLVLSVHLYRTDHADQPAGDQQKENQPCPTARTRSRRSPLPSVPPGQSCPGSCPPW